MCILVVLATKSAKDKGTRACDADDVLDTYTVVPDRQTMLYCAFGRLHAYLYAALRALVIHPRPHV
jgi:hypothetical protein